MILTGVRRAWLFRSAATSTLSFFEERRREADERRWTDMLPTGGTVGFLVALVIFLGCVCYWL